MALKRSSSLLSFASSSSSSSWLAIGIAAMVVASSCYTLAAPCETKAPYPHKGSPSTKHHGKGGGGHKGGRTPSPAPSTPTRPPSTPTRPPSTPTVPAPSVPTRPPSTPTVPAPSVPTPTPTVPTPSIPTPSTPATPSPPITSPPPSRSSTTCPVDIVKLNVCVPILGGILGNPLQSDCCALLGIIGLDVEVCLCAAIDANVLGIITAPVKLDVIATILTTCGYKVPPKLSCPSS